MAEALGVLQQAVVWRSAHDAPRSTGAGAGASENVLMAASGSSVFRRAIATGAVPMQLARLTATCLALASASLQPSANRGHDFMVAMPDKARNARFTEMLVVLPQPYTVPRNFFRGFDKGRAIWAVEYTDKKAYAAVIDDNASSSSCVLDCKVVLERTKLDCFTKL